MTSIATINDPKTSRVIREGSVFGVGFVSYKRPDDTTAYAAGDVISDSDSVAAAIEFPDSAKKVGGSVGILRVTIGVNVNIASPPDLELYVFDTEPTNHLDNAALALVNTDLNNLVACIPLAGTDAKVVNATASPNGALLYTSADGVRAAVCAAGSKSLFALLVTRTGFTPTNTAKFYIRVELDKD